MATLLIESCELTKIELETNVDGIHTKRTTIGYAQEDAFAVLALWLSKYYIIEYNGKSFYPLNHTGFKGAIIITRLGHMFDPRLVNERIASCPSIFSLETLNTSILDIAKIDRDPDYETNGKQYLQLLQIAAGECSDIRDAVDCDDVVKLINDNNDIANLQLNPTRIVDLTGLYKNTHDGNTDNNIRSLLECIFKYIYKIARRN